MGFIRRIHGDLHLGNIVLLDDRPVLFDAIEFSEVIASGDVLYDLAFLLMDLVERNLPAAANIVFNRYLVESGRDENLDALAALPFFLSMRAAIRAKVTAARLERAKPDEQPEIARSARTYFDWARRFIAPAPPVLVAVGGLSGTGKSVLARALAPALAPPPGAVVLRSDVERKTLFGKDELEPLPQEAYTPEVTARVYAAITEKARRAVAAGHSAILDAVFARPDERRQAEQRGGGHRRAFRGTVPRSRPGDARPRAPQRASATPPTPMPTWRAHRRPTISARSPGTASMPRERRTRPCSARKRRWHERRRATTGRQARARHRGRACRLLHLHQSLFPAGAAAVVGGGILRQRRRHQRDHDGRHAGGRAHRAVQRRRRRRARAQARHHRRDGGAGRFRR